MEMDNEDVGKPVADYFGVTGDASKVLGYVGNDVPKKYVFDEEVTFQKIKAFGEDFLEDKLKPFYKSDPIPKSIYASWCGHCQAPEPTYNKHTKHLRGVESLVIAEIDGTTNEQPKARVTSRKFSWVPKISVDSFSNSIPTLIENRADGFSTILFFPARNKSFNLISVDADRTVVTYKFLKKHAVIPFKLEQPTSTSAYEDSNTKQGMKSSSIDAKDEL